MADVHPADKSLRAYHLGQIVGPSAETIKDHIDTCPDCQSRIKTMTLAGGPLPARREAMSAMAKPRATVGEAMPPRQSVSNTNPTLKVPDYDVIRTLGEGGMGIVFLARNTLTQREDALKVLSSHLIDQPNAMERFLQEIQAAVRLDHRNIVRSYTALRVEGGLILVMEYVEGEDLFACVERRGALPIGEACFYAFQVAQGLQHAHERGMVHRDIKPHNLIVTTQDGKRIVKILDFGLAKVTSEGPVDGGITRHGAVIGTADYISPEQIRNARLADIRADIYSLGCTLYYLLNAAPPFAGANSLYDIFQAHHSQDATNLNELRQDVPVELAALVVKMMAKDADARFQTPGEAAAALRRFLPMTAAPQAIASTTKPAASTSRRRDATVVEQVSRPKVPPRDRLVTIDEEVMDLRPRTRNEPQPRPKANQNTKKLLLIGAAGSLATILLIGGAYAYLGSAKNSVVVSALAEKADSKADLTLAKATETVLPRTTEKENWAVRGLVAPPDSFGPRTPVAPSVVSDEHPGKTERITGNDTLDPEDVRSPFETPSENGEPNSPDLGDVESPAEDADGDNPSVPKQSPPVVSSPGDLSYASAARDPRVYLGKAVTIDGYWKVATNFIQGQIPDHETLFIKDQHDATVVDARGRAYGKYTLPVAFDPALRRILGQFLSKAQIRNAILPSYRAIPTVEVREVNSGGREEWFGAIVAMDFVTLMSREALDADIPGKVFTVFRITPAGFEKLDDEMVSQLYEQLGGKADRAGLELAKDRAAKNAKLKAISQQQLRNAARLGDAAKNMIQGDNNRQNGINSSIQRGIRPR